MTRDRRALRAERRLVTRRWLSRECHVGLLARRADGRLFAVIGLTIANGRIAEMDILADPDWLRRLDLSAIER